MFSKVSTTIKYHSKMSVLSSLNFHVSSVVKQHCLSCFHILGLIKPGLILVALCTSLTCVAVL